MKTAPIKTVEDISTVDQKPHATFFRQSGWLMTANILGGLMSFGVHFLNKAIPDGDYRIFGTLLMVITCLPTMPLQMVFAQQTASAFATNRTGQLAGILRLVWMCLSVLWLLAAIGIFMFQGQIVERWNLGSPMPLWITMFTILISLWVPMLSGVLQGRQDFFWIGWSSLLGGVFRLGMAAFLVLVLAGGASGMTAGALAGLILVAIITIWRTRDLLSLPAEPFEVKNLLRQVTPLIFGFGACQFMFTADTIFVNLYFNDAEMKAYIAAGTLSRALLWLVLPLAAVMFPKIVQSTAKSEKTNLLSIVVLGTAVLGICGMLGLWLVGPLVVKIVFKSGDVSATVALLPWYAGAMVPLALANVLLNDLLAREQFSAVPFMVLVAVAYGFTLSFVLHHFPGRLEAVLQTLGAFNLLLFAVCAWFTWGMKGRTKMENGR